MNESLIALVFGATIIVFFAWDQFNRPSYDRSRELTRLIELLAPSDMRRRTVYWRAYIFYATILLLIYFVLCVYGALLLPLIGLDLVGQAPTGGATDAPVAAASEAARQVGYSPDVRPQDLGGQSQPDKSAIDPVVPLTVSLAMVGLAPSVPILLRMEEKIRFAAHRLSGIPTRLVTGSRQLRLKPIDLVEGSDTFLVASQDWERMRHYDRHAGVMLDDPGAFRDDVAKIVAFRAWILQEKLQLDNHATRDSMARIEAGLAKRIERLFFDLDSLTGFETTDSSGAPKRSPEQLRAAWETFAREADLICTDVCVLNMLYVEHGILPTEDDAERFGWPTTLAEDAPEPQRQKFLAQQKLMRFVGDAARWADRDSLSLVLWSRATAAALLVALVYGLLRVENSVAGGGGTGRLLTGVFYVFSATITYALALLVAVSYHQALYQSGAWRNVFRENWARWIPQLGAAFVFAGVAAVFSHVALNLFATMRAVGTDVVLANWQAVLRAAFEYDGPSALRGAVLSVCVILITDAWRNGKESERALHWLPLATGGVMLVAGLLSRHLTSQAAYAGYVSRGNPEAYVYPAASVIDAGLLAMLIGLAVGYFVRGTLVHVFSRALSRAARPEEQSGQLRLRLDPAE